jgi:Salmonella virulence plasmid 65kDa B protein
MDAYGGRERRGTGAVDLRPAQQPGPATGSTPESPGTTSAPDPPPSNAPASIPLPAISLPKGSGALRGMGEKVAVNAANGSASATIPVPLGPGRGGFGPKLALGYSSGAGNGPFGFGWSLDTPTITRKTDKGLPRYDDGGESDVFILSGAEDLVPVLDAKGERQSLSRTVWGTAYLIHFYRPRIEGLYARIERWTEVATGLSHWRSISRDNVSTLYGYDTASRVSNPADPTHVFAWHISRSWDARGNLMVHDYIREDGAGIDTTSAHEANRSPAARAA